MAVIDPHVDLRALAAAAGIEQPALDEHPAGEQVRVVVTGERPVGADLLDRLPGLRGVVTCSTGFDHLDLPALAGRGVLACNCPTYCTDEVADHALALVLACWRGLLPLTQQVRSGGWDWTAAGPLRGTAGSRLGILGLGRIGGRLARSALALGIEVLGHDPGRSPAALAVLGVTPTPLPDLLATSHAVSLHLPGPAPGAPPVLGAAELDLLHPDAVLVNVARAAVVDLDALADRLRSGRLRMAAFDVWPQEPPDPADPRLRLPNLLLTPHAAWYSDRAEAALWREAGSAVRALLDGRPPATGLLP